MWKRKRKQCSGHAHRRGRTHGKVIRSAQPVKQPCAIIETHYGLHALAYTYNNGNEQLRVSGENAHGRHRRVAAMTVQHIVDYGIDCASGTID